MTSPPNPTVSAHSPEARRFVRHLGLHHFAHLRAVIKGLDIAQCDARYLGTEHGHEARSAYQQIVDVVCSTALRRSKPWRVVGLSIKTTETEQIGHTSIQTMMAIYGRTPNERRVGELGKAFS